MTRRRLAPDERALWARVVAAVRPIRVKPPAGVAVPVVEAPKHVAKPKRLANATPGPSVAKPPIRAANTLDGGWDRRLTRGAVVPDFSVDFHGHTLSSAHALLERSLSEAVAREARVLLLVTGRPPREGETRGAIRAAMGDWLAGSLHAARIAAVRGAHPRHGGTGALYVILRRPAQPRG